MALQKKEIIAVAIHKFYLLAMSFEYQRFCVKPAIFNVP